MRAVLPGLAKPVTIAYVCELIGPRVDPSHLTPDLLEEIRAIELGKKDIPTLPVDAIGNVVFTEPSWPSDKVLRDWQLLKLGAFSSCMIKRMTLTPKAMTANRAWTFQRNETARVQTAELAARLGTTVDDVWQADEGIIEEEIVCDDEEFGDDLPADVLDRELP